jgi:dihydrolipoamide dehydrogenase
MTMQTKKTTLLVIGGGPAGYVAAIRAGQLKIPTILVEGNQLGGTCLNIGCIPSKALIHAAEEFGKAMHWASGSPLGISVDKPRIEIEKTVLWKDGIVKKLTGGVGALLKKNGAQVVRGWATIVDGKTVEVASTDGGEALRIECEHLVLAAGSIPVELPFMPFSESVWSSEQALSPAAVPKTLVVVGAGYIGLELGMAYAKLGAKVVVVESANRILPAYDEELARPVMGACKRLGIAVRLGCSVTGYDEKGAQVSVRADLGDEFLLPAEKVLVAVGRKARLDGYGLESLGLDMDGRCLKVDDQCRTSMRNVWAIGDLTGEPMLAHRGMAQGEMVAEVVSGRKRRFDPLAMPAICFTDPEVVSVGLAPGAGGLITGLFPFAANGRSMTLESSEGFVRVVARADSHLVVGWQAVGAGVSELAAAFAQSIEMGARLEDVAATIHAHPSLGEAVQEAALKALGHALHV